MKAVILAGGKGTRLRPYTTNFPKPLMPVGERPILELVIAQLRRAGIKQIIITTGHLEGLIRAYFNSGQDFGVEITYSNEDEPLGTAGPLNLLRDRLKETFLVMNGDVLCDLDFDRFLCYHGSQGGTATVALSKRRVLIDFGVVESSKDHRFTRWKEKPTISYHVSTGIYLFEPAALNSLPPQGLFNLPDFIVQLDQDGEKVLTYEHDGYWLDIGRPEDYDKACREFDEKVLLCSGVK